MRIYKKTYFVELYMQPLFARGNKKTIAKLLAKKKEANREGKHRISTRCHAIILSIEKYTSCEIAELLKVNRTGVPIWINNWNELGAEGLLEGHRSGRKSGLGPEEVVQLKDIIDSGPVAYGLNTGIWTSIILSNVIEEEFGIKYHPGHTRKLLKKIKVSFQRPTYKLISADPIKRNKWIRYTYPNLKKTLKLRMQK